MKEWEMSLDTFLRDKVVLVTGGAGSIGSQLVRRILEFGPRAVRALDNNEAGLFDLEQDTGSASLRTFIGDVRDRDRLQRAIEGVDILFHAAALKHVPLCEYNPFDAVRTNVIGTQNVLDASLDGEVSKVVTISTDKAVNPTSVMGATKLLSEKLTISADSYKGRRKTVFACVRFGNVLDSRGSVVPVFKKQIANGGPVTITDPEMTRFILGIKSAVDLVLKAAEDAKGGEVYILRMPSIRIIDLAEVMRDELAERSGHRISEIKIEVVGRRAGEKTHEELMTEEETKHAVEVDDLYVLRPGYSNMSDSLGYSSEYATRIDKNGISVILRENGIL
jgi:FlaA1/EpsC-like NDP-sugar epimerase